jgi:hypothetical protein
MQRFFKKKEAAEESDDDDSSVLPPKDVPAKQTKATRRLFLSLRAGIKSNICSTATAVADPFPGTVVTAITGTLPPSFSC